MESHNKYCNPDLPCSCGWFRKRENKEKEWQQEARHEVSRFVLGMMLWRYEQAEAFKRGS